MRGVALALLLLVGIETAAQEGAGDAAAPRAAAPADPLRYPVPLAEPDFIAPGEPFKLYELRYAFSDTFSTTHSFAARVRTGEWGIAGAELEGEERRLTLETHRLRLSAGAAEGSYDLFASYRARRFVASLGAVQRSSPGEPRGWRVSPALSVRLSADLELVGRIAGDSRRPLGRFLRASSVGFLWQRGAHLEVDGTYGRAWEATGGGYESTRDRGTLGVVAQVGLAELSAEGVLDDVRGLFSARQLEGVVAARVAPAPRLLLEGGARVRSERGVGELSHEYRGGVTWFARRFTLPRAGRTAERAVVLQRRACERGYAERRVFDENGLRAQRERLSLSPWREELVGDMRALYVAEVAERAVPSLGFEIVARRDALARVRSRTLRATVAVPWPPTWPGPGREDAVRFLRLDLERERVLSGPLYESVRYSVALAASLNREMDLVFRWGREEPTPLDLVRGIGERRTVEVAYVYAFGR